VKRKLLEGTPGNRRPHVQMIEGFPEKMVEKHHYKELPENVEEKPEGDPFEKVRVDKVEFEKAQHEREPLETTMVGHGLADCLLFGVVGSARHVLGQNAAKQWQNRHYHSWIGQCQICTGKSPMIRC
jgi:hypothetical protein